MCDAMIHRGPDDEGYVFFHVKDKPFGNEGYWLERGAEMPRLRNQDEWKAHFDGNGHFNLALGHRRLSIIDLSANGHQPMSNRANGIWVTYNGEIYNYRELRSELEQKGHHFFSRSDTEVLIHLYEEYGEQAIDRLNGIFAFGLWDGRRNRLILARDRYGAKPLYYNVKNDMLSFASEVKALLEVDGIDVKPDERALCDYFTFQNTFGDTTLFKDIDLLEAGHYLLIEDENIRKVRYWDFNFSNDKDLGESFYIDRLRSVFSSAIERQLVSDVPVGSYLSGGLDSGSITAFASRHIPRLMTFTGGFDVATAVSIENFFDERQKAELISRAYGTEHYQMVIHAGDLEWALPRVVFYGEDLRVGMSYPHYYLSQLAGKFVKVVLAGPGGDETLGGYPWRYNMVRDSQSPEEFERSIYDYWSRLVKDRDKNSFFSQQMTDVLGDYNSMESMRKVLRAGQGECNFSKALYLDAKTFLHGILVIEDKLSMAHSLESRVPFLDNELVDFTSSIPEKYLINDQWINAAKDDINLSGKYIFRRAMENILPDEITMNRKQGFSAPDQTWYMKHLVGYIRSMILSDRCLDRGYFCKDYLEKVLDEHVAGRVNHRLLIWSLLSFEWWNRLFVDGDKIDGSDRTQAGITRQQHGRTASSLSVPEPNYC
jgi:asparagine synthase (glutamine-hydrolysing)